MKLESFFFLDNTLHRTYFEKPTSMALKNFLQKQKAQKNQVASRIMYLLVNSKGTMGPKDQRPILIPPQTLCHTPSLPENRQQFSTVSFRMVSSVRHADSRTDSNMSRWGDPCHAQRPSVYSLSLACNNQLSNTVAHLGSTGLFKYT